MTILTSTNFADLGAGVTVVGYVWNNGAGGSGTPPTMNLLSANSMVGSASQGMVAGVPSTSSYSGIGSFTRPKWGRVPVQVDQSGGNANFYGFNVWNKSQTASNTPYINFVITPTFLSIRVVRVGGASTTLRQVSYTRPAGTIYVDVEADPRYGLTINVRTTPGGTILGTVNYLLTEAGLTDWRDVLAGSTAGGVGYFSSPAPQVAIFKTIAIDDMQSGGTAPTTSARSSTKTGKTTADIAYTVDAAAVNGEVWVYYSKTNTAPTTPEQFFDFNVYSIISSAGAKITGISNLDPASTYYAWVMPRSGAGRDIGAINSAGSFTTDPAVDPPVIQSVICEARGNDVTVTVTMASGSGPVANMPVTVPAHATPDGAVTLGPINATYDSGTGKWIAAFMNANSGRYSFASATANGPDGGTATQTATKTLRIIPLTGIAQA